MTRYAVMESMPIYNNRDGICGERRYLSAMRYITVEGAWAAMLMTERKYSTWDEEYKQWRSPDDLHVSVWDCVEGKTVWSIQKGYNKLLGPPDNGWNDNASDELPF